MAASPELRHPNAARNRILAIQVEVNADPSLAVDVDLLALIAFVGDDLGRLRTANEGFSRRQRRAERAVAARLFIRAVIGIAAPTARSIVLRGKGMRAAQHEVFDVLRALKVILERHRAARK